MLLYRIAIAVFVLFAGYLLWQVNWYTALVSLGIALALYFIMLSTNAEDND